MSSSLGMLVAHVVDTEFDASSDLGKFGLWHRRLGHPLVEILVHCLKSCNFSVLRSLIRSLCNACELGKFHKLPFFSSHTMYSEPLELIVVDLLGLTPYFSDGKQYYISFVDAYARHTWIYFLTNKFDALFTFLLFKKQVELQSACKIKQIQIDGGGEFRSFAFASQLHNFGIQHRISCPHTSEQNGLVERHHRQIVETGLVLLAQASLSFWSNAFPTLVHLTNCLLTKALRGLTPIMRLFGKQTDIQFHKVFGCQCYPFLRPYNRHKMQYMSTSSVFLGYAENHKGYKCMDHHGCIYISRHVKFAKNIFPSQKSVFDSSLVAGSHSSPWTLTHLPVLVQTFGVMVNRPSFTEVIDGAGSFSPSSEGFQSEEMVGTEQNPKAFDVAAVVDGAADVSDVVTVVDDDAAGVAGTNDSIDAVEVADPVSPEHIIPRGGYPFSNNVHPLVTRSKVGVFKPKVYVAQPSLIELKDVYEAMLIPSWKKVVDEELKALIKNRHMGVSVCSRTLKLGGV